jgi:hypothetical protein
LSGTSYEINSVLFYVDILIGMNNRIVDTKLLKCLKEKLRKRYEDNNIDNVAKNIK